ncbi:MAG: HD-GYP domain-containing protein [Lachnospiraceae bacterium]|nr:HD-GYP domain-containing protein [Lachnospiraceae bacterium]
MNKSGKTAGIVAYITLLVLFLITSFFTSRFASSEGTVMIFGMPIPLSSFTGVLSSVGSFCIIFMVVFQKKRGFITALLLLLMQFPFMLMGFIRAKTLMTFPGLFNNTLTIIAIIIIYRRNVMIDRYQKIEVDYLKGKQQASRRLFEQTSTALVNAVDAKDTYSHGHSLRVAEYSEKIARMMGKDEEECQKIYYAALLHDVGKIGIPNTIINKKGKLDPEEYEVIKQHPGKGNSILSSISEYPYLSIGAHFHHERYDGKGYPEKLKGEDIPEIARIISVADAYDAMSSNRSYRNALPQQLVREEIVKGAGTQFDPEIAKIMQALIDQDPTYQMKEKDTVDELAGKSGLDCTEYRREISDGIIVTACKTKFCMTVTPNEIDTDGEGRGAALILFDSLDERVHEDPKTISELCYYEYCTIWLDGLTENKGVRKVQTNHSLRGEEPNRAPGQPDSVIYEIEAVKYRDHVLILIDDGAQTEKITIALPDSSRYVYIGLTGEQCRISDVSIRKDTEPVNDTYIDRIADEISYIDGPTGDIPNVQVDGQGTDASEGISVKDHLVVSFHTMSLPTARLVWHCPYFVVFSSRDGKVNGPDYKEYAVVRLDGECNETTGPAKNKLTVNKQDHFAGWDAWKEANKKGFDCVVSFTRYENTIAMMTENFGIAIKNTTIVTGNVGELYVALTGDQCALTNIRIER